MEDNAGLTYPTPNGPKKQNCQSVMKKAKFLKSGK